MNSGTFRLSQAGSSSFGASFNNLPGGTIEVTSGTLDLAGGGTWQGANLQIGQGAAVAFTSGTLNVSGILAGSGQGVFRLGGGTQGASEGAMLLMGGGDVTVNFPNGVFEFSGNATIAGGTFLNQGVMVIADRPDLQATLERRIAELKTPGLDGAGPPALHSCPPGGIWI